jgi:hypothetical protein
LSLICFIFAISFSETPDIPLENVAFSF